MYWHIDTDIIGLLVICALYYYTVKMLPSDKYTAQNKCFVWCLLSGIIMTVIDIAASVAMEVPVSWFVYQLLMILYLLVQDLAIIMWIMYALTILYKDDEKGRKHMTITIWALYSAYSLLVISNPWTELFFSLGPNNEYARGPLFLPGLLGLYYICAVALIVLIFVRRKHIPEGYPKIVLYMQPVILSIAVPFQLLNPGWLMLFPAYMLCLLLAFLFFQNARVRSERAQLQQLTEIVEHFACGMSICKLEGELMEVQYVSGGLADIYETETDSLRESFNSDMLYGVHPDDRDIVRTMLDVTNKQYGEREITYRYITESGRLKWVNAHVEAVEHGNDTATIYATYTDLTELKKAENLIDVALVNTGVSIWEYDFERKCIIQYQNSTEMHGFEKIVPNVPQSLVESGFVHPDSAAEFLAMYEKLFAGAAFAEGVFKVQTSDRKGYWYEHIRYTNAFDENGKPYRAVGMSTDETQRQEAIAKYERELEKERGFMSEEGLLAHATFDLSTGATLDYRYPDGSEVAECDKTTFSHARASAGMLIDGEERARYLAFNDVEALLAHFAAGETELRQEYRRILPSGLVNWVRNTLRMLRDPRSGNILLFEYWYDIETEKMMELMYSSIATDNYDFVARIDGITKRFDVIAKAGLTYHMPPTSGKDADAVTLSLYSECVAPEDRDTTIQNSLIDNVRRHLQERGRFVFTYKMICPDGSVRYKRVTQYYIDPQREIIAMMREDVTDLIFSEMEKNRMLADALETANQASQAKSQFLSRVSHELRTPLNAIIGFLELSKGADKEQIETYMENSNVAAKQLLAIINDVLDVSSIESGKLKIAYAPFDFKRLIRNIGDLYEPQCRQKGISYETVMLTKTDDWLKGDQLRVKQILFNLLNNSLKFTARGGICLKISQRPAQRDKVIVRFEVSDTGCGMSAEMRERLFKPFEQESTLTAQKYGGNGLGLFIVGSLVGMMDGAVSVKSRPDDGSTFTIDLPFTRGEPELASFETSEGERSKATYGGTEPLPLEFDFSGKRILLAEDNAMNRMVAETMICKKFGAQCDCAEDGKIALDMFLSSPVNYYDIILMDIQMPNMDGFEATKQIRASSRADASQIQIIALTANAFNEDVEKSLSNGMNAHVAKPIEPDLLGAALAQAFIAREKA